MLAKIKTYAIGALILFAVSTTGVLYVTHLQGKIEVLSRQNQALEDNLQTERETVAFQEFQNKVNEDRLVALDKDRQEYVVQINYLRGIFGRHNFTELVEKKPGLITTRMIKATRKLWEEVSDVTHSN